MNKKSILILISSVIVIVVVIVIVAQSYPIAFVNWQPISLKSFKKDSATVIHYYQKALETYNKNQAAIMESLEVRQEIERAVLDKLIENILIHRELKKRLKSDELEKMVDNKIEETVKDKDINEEIEVLYALSLNEFKERVLGPQARQEILEARLLLENKDFNEWLGKAKKESKIIILLPNFKWNGNEVIVEK